MVRLCTLGKWYYVLNIGWGAVFTLFMIFGSVKYEHTPDPLFSETEKALIRQFFAEQGVGDIDDFWSFPDQYIAYEYDNWPNDGNIVRYAIVVNDTDVHNIVLSDIVTKITAESLRFSGIRFGYINGINVDSIEIRTEEVIVLPLLDITKCNLDRLPPEIGNVWTKELDIGWNKISALPVEITAMDSIPQPYASLTVKFDRLWSQNSFDTLPVWT